MVKTQSSLMSSGLALAIALLALPWSRDARAEQSGIRLYQVTLTNLSAGQPLSPPLVVTHEPGVDIFSVGEQASEGIQAIAETGNNAVLAAALDGAAGIADVVATADPLHRVGGPGSSTMTVTVRGQGAADRLSLASMLACTNDGFAGLDSARLPRGFAPADFYVAGYDAGTEANTQLFTDLPGGCNLIGPMPVPPDDMNEHVPADEAIRMHPGIIDGLGNFTTAFAWSDPILKVTVQRVE